VSWKVPECTIVKAKYDRDTDTLKLVLREGVAVSESDEDKPGVILDYDQEGNLVSIEVLDASKRMDAADKIELEMTG
jgi:YD repeat-containing protein